ncbi:nicotinate-nucleotide--dimethylbenzimidazole phosphoribosyltransferase [Streptomyces sp. NPDC001743]|uniref:nicotinate-nucleotide--dimethylbenzimidazole phosphoribosyltransferase n=1 Tax=Streptomyces sp. NPDC001743 TaxID=3154397 RepID=UPI0033177A53
MSDTGQIPGEGLPENAGMVEQQGIPAPGDYTFLDPSEHASEDDDLLLMPSPQGAWSEPQAVQAPPAEQGPAYQHAPAQQSQGDGGVPFPEQAQAPVYAMQQAGASFEEPAQGTHESGGRNSGHVDLGGVRIPSPAPAPAQAQVPAAQAQAPARRPLHRGPSAESGPSYGGTSGGGVVRSLADRGPAGTSRPQAQPQAAVQSPARHAGPATAEPEYFELPADEAAALPGPQLGQIPPQGAGQWAAHAPQQPAAPVAAPPAAEAEPSVPEPSAAETVVPEAAGAEPTAEEPVAGTQAEGPAPVAQSVEEVRVDVAPAEPVPVETVPVETAPVEPAPVETAPAVADGPAAGPVAAGIPAEALEETARAEAPEEAVPAQAAPALVEAAPADTVAVAEPEAPAEAAPSEAVMAEAAPVEAAPVEVARGEEPVFEPAPAEPVAPVEVAPAEEPVAEALPFEAAPAHEAQAEEAPFEAAAPVRPPVEPVPDGASLGRFVPVAGSLPTTPHLAPAPAAEQPAHPAPEAAAVVAESGPAGAAREPVVETPAPHPATEPAPAPEPTEPALTESAPAPEFTEPAPHPVTGSAPGPELTESAPETGPEVIETPDLTVNQPEPTRPEAATEPATADAPAAPQDSGEAPAAEAGQAPAVSPPAPGYDDAEREAVLRVMRERRDIRNGFRSDPVPHEVLLRVLEAAHTAPSVGHSQPWDFVVIRSAETRRSMHELAQRQREAYAQSLPKARAKQFKELKIEAILDTPVNIVVTADPTRGGRHTLGRHTQPQMAPYSSALAVENLWLAARAEGLGVGWVSFFDEREMVRALGLPEHLEVVAYLCVGYVDEFPEEPELMQAGWSKRRPLSWVVHEETYGRRALPGEEPHDLLQETIAGIRPLDAKALGEAWERQKRMTKPAGALGMLEIISAQLSGLSRMCPPPIPEPAAVAIFAGDHGVHAQGVTAWPQEVTGQMVANFLGGGAVCNAFAAQVGAEVCVVDVGVATDLPAQSGLLPRKVRAGTADFTTGPALTREEVLAAIEVGIETARDLVAAGNKGLLTGEMGIANTTASAALICVYTGMDPSEVTGRGTGINDEMHARKIDVVRRALDLHQPDPADPIGVLAAVGGLEHAAMAGFLLGGASLRTPVILDGVSAGAAALVARAIAPEALAACIAGHRSAEPGHVAALNKLGLRPLVDLDLRLGEGTGALLALPIVQSAARAMHEVATFDSAGVTEK